MIQKDSKLTYGEVNDLINKYPQLLENNEPI